MTDGLTAYVAEWVLGLAYESLPNLVRRQALEHIYDGYGLALSARHEESHKIIRKYVESQGGDRAVGIWGTSQRVSASLAALVNGLAIHALDYDDTQLSTNPASVYGLLTHPTAPVLAAAAAVAEMVGASGKDLITAYVGGVEVACRLADAMYPRHYNDGFHSTGTVGALGAVAAAGKLLELDESQMRIAFGIAAPLGGGYRENFGTMTKPLHAGIAASAGVTAAWLAREGFTASDSILEAARGFFSAAAGGYERERVQGRLGNPYYFEDPGVSIKPYPCGSLSHPALDGILSMIYEYDIHPERVVEVVAYTNSAMLNALIYRYPKTDLEAKFSLAFLLAAAVLFRRVGIHEFRDDIVHRDDVHAMIGRCHHRSDPEIDKRGFQHMETRIVITLDDGRNLERTEWRASGHPKKPMSAKQLQAKFAECASMTLTPEETERASQRIWRLETLNSVGAVHEALIPRSAV